MELKHVIKNIDGINNAEFNHTEVYGIEDDSRKCFENSLFAAIKGYDSDGHDHILKSIGLGAKFILFEDADKLKSILAIGELPGTNPFGYKGTVYIKSNNTRRDFATIVNNYYDNPSSRVSIVGVTGTNGKTSVVNFISDMLEANGKITGTIGTIGNKINDKFYKTKNTTPGTLQLQKLFCEMVAEGVDNCIMEVSSHSLEMHRVDGIQFDIGVFTNLTPEHLDFHNDMESYFMAKSKLFDNVRIGSVVNIDDPYGDRLFNELSSKGHNVLSYGLDINSDIYAKNIEFDKDGTKFQIVMSDCSINVSISFPGIFYVYNTLAAIGAMILMDFTKEEIGESINAIKQITGRMQSVENDRGIYIIVDYAHTPDGMRKVLETAKAFTKGKIITVFGCPGERDKTKRPVMGKIASDLSDYSIISDDDPKSEDPDVIIKEIESGFESGNYSVARSRKSAIEKAISMAVTGDSVLLLGKGHESSITIKDTVIESNDLNIVREILERK